MIKSNLSHRSFVRRQAGFTLIEILVVISVIGILAGLLLTNFVGVRERAADTSLKNDLRQLKTALRLYYNDVGSYPDAGAGATIQGCGSPAGTSVCADAFSSGTTVYMNELPADFAYYSDGIDSFLLVATLANASDDDITASVNRCDPASRGYFGQTVGPTDYFVCED